MKMSRLIIVATLLLILIVVSCNVLKKEDNLTEVRTFISSFQASLALTDEEILTQFEASQSKESLLTAIRILQNKEHQHIECVVDFSGAAIVKSNEDILVSFNASFKPKDLNVDNETPKTAVLTFKLKRKQKSFVIAELQGEKFHEAFADLRSDLLWPMEQNNEIERRQPIYARAREIQQNFDSVIWFARYQSVNYFYVVNGDWSVEQFIEGSSTCLIGIVDDQGKEVVPVKYTFVGTIGSGGENIVEVGNAGKVGHFDIRDKQEVIQPQYDMIIPYNNEEAAAIVKKDSVYGWLDNNNEFRSGFPSQHAEQWVRSFGFIPTSLRISGTTEGICESPTESQIGRGVFMPSSFLSNTGIFDRVIDGISTTAIPMHGWTEYIEASGTRINSISENLSALITTISERYLEGREEFYTSDRFVLVNEKNETLATSNILEGAEITRPNDSTLQVKAISSYEYESEFEDISGMPEYRFYKMKGASVIPLETNRLFAPAKFLKLDSTYLQGNFSRYDAQAETSEQRTFLSPAAISYIRNEILASYGYRFPEPELQEKFQYRTPAEKYDSIEEVRALMTDVERYNLDFLERVLNAMTGTVM